MSANFDKALCTQLRLLPLAWEVCVCLRVCVHGDDPPSAPLECLQCAERRRRSVWVYPRSLLGPAVGPKQYDCLDLWFSLLTHQKSRKHLERIAQCQCICGHDNCQIVLNNLLHWCHEPIGQVALIRLCQKVTCMRLWFLWEEKNAVDLKEFMWWWSEISQAERVREAHMWIVKRVNQQPLWYPPLGWLQLAWSLVKKTAHLYNECTKKLIRKMKLTFPI